MGKKHGPEEIIGKLREAEIVMAQGGTASDACRRIGVSEQTYWTEIGRDFVWLSESLTPRMKAADCRDYRPAAQQAAEGTLESSNP